MPKKPTTRRTMPADQAVVRDILARVTDPDHPEHVHQSTIEDAANAWSAAYSRVCTALGIQATAEAQASVYNAVLGATPFGLKDAVIDAFRDAMLQTGVVWPGLCRGASKAHGSYQWSDEMADEIALLGGAQGGVGGLLP